MKITKNIIPREQALKISPEYVAFAEGDYDHFDLISKQFESVKRGQKALSAVRGENRKVIFVTGKITSVNNDDYRAMDGPVVRFSNDEFSWRIDGDKYAFLY